MEEVFVVANIEGEALAIFTTEAKARAWLESRVRAQIAKGYYGKDVPPDVELSWRAGRTLGFCRTSFGVYGWHAVSEEIDEFPLDPGVGWDGHS